MMWKGWIIGLAALCLLTATASAQQYHFHNYTGEDGLSQVGVMASFQDRDGYVWIGTEAGLNRFDGRHFEVFGVRQGLANDWINALTQDREGRIWAGTNNGLSSWTETGGFQNYTVADGLPDKHVYTLAATPEGALWVGTGNGLASLDGHTFEAFTTAHGLPAGHIYAVLLDQAGRLWIGTNEGLYTRAGESFVAFDAVPREPVYELAEDARGRLWVGVGEQVQLIDQGRRVAVYSEEDGLLGLPARAIYAAQDSVVWVGTIKGLGMIEGADVRFITMDHGLPFVDVSVLLEDRESIIWAGGYGGIAKFLGRAFTNYRTSDGLASSIARPIVRGPQGDLWVGTVRGLSRFDGVSWQSFTEKDGLSSAYVEALYLDQQDRLWIGTFRGLNYYDGSRFHKFAGLYPEANVVSIAEDHDGRLWVAARNDGIYRRDTEGFERVEVPNQSFINGRLLVDSRGDVWASGDYGLSRWDGARWTTFTTDDGLAAAEPYFMAEDQSGRLWFGYHSSHGITVYNGSTFTTYTTDDGLANDAVFSVGVDQRDNIWIGTARGVDRFDGETFVNYGPAEGYASNESNAGGFFADHDGKLWFSTAEGVSHYDPRYDLSSSSPPHVKIHRLWLGGAAERIDAAITVPYVRRDLQATVVSLSYINPKKLTLRYRLTGYDEAWRALEGREIHYTNLPAGPYTLEVQARKQQSGWSASATVGFQIEKPYWQTWWFRISVMLTLFLLTLGTVVVAYRVQRRRLIRRERQRAEIEQAQLRAQASKAEVATAQAREAQAHARALQAENERNEIELEKARETAHLVEQLKRSNEELEQFASAVSHDLQEPLRTITSFVGLLQMRYQGQLDEDADTFIGYINDGSERMLALIRDLLSFSRLGRQQLDRQPVDMGMVLEQTLAGIRTALEEADAEVIIDPLPTVEGDATQLGMVLQNLIGNGIKFRGEAAPRVQVSALQHNGVWRFAVRDNGIGIKEAYQQKIFEIFERLHSQSEYEGTGIGLATCKKIVERHGGRIWVESEEGEGTTFFFTIPA